LYVAEQNLFMLEINLLREGLFFGYSEKLGVFRKSNKSMFYYINIAKNIVLFYKI